VEKIGGRKEEKGEASTEKRGPVPLVLPIFLNFFKVFFGLMRNFLAFWKNGCTTPPFFEACPYTWKR
jgi:hypothetical protein